MCQRYKRRSALRLLWQGPELVCWVDGNSTPLSPQDLLLIDALGAPQSLDALANVLSVSAEELDARVQRLLRAGVVQLEGQVEGSWQAGFAVLANQARMLDDRERTEIFLEALAAVIEDGDHVLDIGTGNGVLSLAAAKLGAKKVSSIEVSDLAEIASALFEANGVAEKIALHRAWSSAVELEEQADLLVTETVGHDPFAEGILETVLDAKARLLKPGARILPAGLRLYALPVSVPIDILQSLAFAPQATARWQQWYGFDFNPLQDPRWLAAQWVFVAPSDVIWWPRLAPATLLQEVDFATLQSAQLSAQVQTQVTEAGSFNGVLLYFEIEVAPGYRYSTRPGTAPPSCSWKNPLWLLPSSSELVPGQILHLNYTFSPAAGSRVAATVEPL